MSTTSPMNRSPDMSATKSSKFLETGEKSTGSNNFFMGIAGLLNFLLFWFDGTDDRDLFLEGCLDGRLDIDLDLDQLRSTQTPYLLAEFL